MISIFDDTEARLSVQWNGIDFNSPTLTRSAQSGHRLESVGYSTPTNMHTEMIADIIKNGGGHEMYNPIVGTRVLNLRGSTRADSESELMDLIINLQRAFHPLSLQTLYGLNHAGTLTWPPPGGLPDWVRAKPLTFTRVMPTDTAPGAFADGKFALQYHVVPLELPDPIRSSVLQGYGYEWEAQFLIMDGGRSFSQAESSMHSDGTVTPTWGKAPMWPVWQWDMTAAGATNFTITTGGTMGTAMVFDLSDLSTDDHIDVDTRDRSIWVNQARSYSIYSSGEFPILNGNGNATTVAYTNLTGVINPFVFYRESDYV